MELLVKCAVEQVITQGHLHGAPVFTDRATAISHTMHGQHFDSTVAKLVPKQP